TPAQSQAQSGEGNGASGQGSAWATPAMESRAETVLIDLPEFLESAKPVVLCWPMPDSATGQKQWALIRLSKADHAVTPDDFSHVNESLRASHQLAMKKPAALPTAFLSRRADIAATLELLPLKKQRRSALVALAGTANASLTGDLAL